MTKQEAMKRWAGLTANMPLKPHVIPYKAEGSSYGADAIRITGSSEFVDSVLSRLMDLMDYENGQTRLGFSRNPVDLSKVKADGSKLGAGVPESCYIQVCARGRDAQAMNAWLEAMTS
jgi:hypothetical protein